jgi:hypothetical protein
VYDVPKLAWRGPRRVPMREGREADTECMRVRKGGPARKPTKRGKPEPKTRVWPRATRWQAIAAPRCDTGVFIAILPSLQWPYCNRQGGAAAGREANSLFLRKVSLDQKLV